MTDAEAMEQERRRCEIRELLRLGAQKGHEEVAQRFIKIEAKRGAAATDRLRSDYKTQWRAGNRGTHGDWRELGLT